MIREFTKKPVKIRAVQWTGYNTDEVKKFIGPDDFLGVIGSYKDTNNSLCINTLEGYIYASPGDWIIEGVNGEHYPCKPDIFEKTYDAGFVVKE